MNIITDPGFETAEGVSWDYYNGAKRYTGSDAYVGDGYAFVGFRTGTFGTGYVEELALSLTLGNVYQVRLRCMSNGASHNELRVRLDVGDGAYATQAARCADAAAWELWGCGQFTALGTVGRIRIQCLNPSIHNHGWYLDEVMVIDTEAGMAVRLAERAVDAIVTLLKANLATELTAIDTERADGITMVAPGDAHYFKRPKATTHEGTASVEVFESDLEFTNPYTDAAAERAAYRLPITVRVTYCNAGGDTPDTMMIRMRRYSAGVFNVINKNYDLGDADDATKSVVVERVSAHWETEGEDADKVNKVQSTIELEVGCEELQA